MILIFGCGTGLDFFLKYEMQPKVKYFLVDNDKTRFGDTFQGFEVRSINEFSVESVDMVVVVSRHFYDIYKQLVSIGFSKEKIKISNYFLSV